MFTWAQHLILHGGPAGIVFLMAIETVFPLVPSEVIMPLAGFEAARGDIGFSAVVAAGTAGSVIGGLGWYALGRWLGLSRMKRWAGRYGRWLVVTPGEIEVADRWFRRWAGPAVLVGRTMPIVRGVICTPAGIARMPLLRFLVLSTIGCLVFNLALAVAGRVLQDHYREIGAYLDPVCDAAIALGFGWYVFRVVTFRRRRGEPA